MSHMTIGKDSEDVFSSFYLYFHELLHNFSSYLFVHNDVI